jgi:transcriptional regulator with GAF, ATPase, and Fis domain
LRATVRRLHLRERTLSAADQAALLGYDFPGNVRELQNIIERAVVLAPDRYDGLGLSLGRTASMQLAPSPDPHEPEPGDAVMPEEKFRDFERRNVLNALKRCDFRIAGERGAAKLLGLSPSTLSYRMKQLGIERPR